MTENKVKDGEMHQVGLTIDEVASRLQLRPTTIRAYLREGRIPGVKFGRVWRVAESTVNDLLAGRIAVNGNGNGNGTAAADSQGNEPGAGPPD